MKAEEREQTIEQKNANLILGAFFLLIGLVSLFRGIPAAWFSAQSGYWQITKGEITRLEKGRCSRFHSCELLVEYSYEANGSNYVGHYLYPEQDIALNQSEFKKIREKFETGTSVTVYYDLKKPDRACLIRGIIGDQLGTLVVGIGFTILALISVIWLK